MWPSNLGNWAINMIGRFFLLFSYLRSTNLTRQNRHALKMKSRFLKLSTIRISYVYMTRGNLYATPIKREFLFSSPSSWLLGPWRGMCNVHICTCMTIGCNVSWWLSHYEFSYYQSNMLVWLALNHLWLIMYVCMYVRTVCMYVCMCVCMYVCLYVCMYVCM